MAWNSSRPGGRAAIGVQAELIELVALRGQVLGRIGDYEWAEERAEQLTRDAPADGMAVVARARARGRFHRFADALADLDGRSGLGPIPPSCTPNAPASFRRLDATRRP
jgi:hypothetical protein